MAMHPSAPKAVLKDVLEGNYTVVQAHAISGVVLAESSDNLTFDIWASP
jgi:hypothetical protein